MIKRLRCGATDCLHNKQFRCELESIKTDETSKCLDYKNEND